MHKTLAILAKIWRTIIFVPMFACYLLGIGLAWIGGNSRYASEELFRYP